MKVHPLLNKDFILIQTVLHNLRLQLQWSSSNSISHLLMTAQTILQGKERTQSETGFIGPHLNQVFKEVMQLMKSSLKKDQQELIDLIDVFNQLLFLGTFYVSSQLLDNWKELFPQQDPAAAFKAGLLLKELGLTFILGSHLIQSSYLSIAEGLKIEEKAQKQISNLGMCFILGMLVVAEDQNKLADEDFLSTLQKTLRPVLNSLEFAIQEEQFQGIIENERAALALTQIQLIQQVIEKGETDMLKQIVKDSCEVFGLSYEGLSQDLKHVIQICSQLNVTFKNIFYQSQQRSTTLTQSA